MPGKHKTKLVGFYPGAELVDRISAAASASGQSVSAFLREAAEAACNAVEHDRAAKRRGVHVMPAWTGPESPQTPVELDDDEPPPRRARR